MISLSKSLPKPLSFPRPAAWWSAIVVALALGLAAQADRGLLDRAFAATIGALKPARAEGAVTALSDYRVSVEARPVGGVTRKIAGLAWDAQRQHLWTVANDPPRLLALDERGDVLAHHLLEGFDDVAGVTVLDDDRLLLAEAGRQALVVVPVPRRPDEALSRAGRPALRLASEGGNGVGFEGIAYDPAGDRLFALIAHAPGTLREIRGLRASLTAGGEVEVIDRSAWLRDKLVARDFASVEFDPRTGHLILVSNGSRLALEIDGDGRYVGYQGFAAGFAGLADGIAQIRGLTLDGRGNLYAVSDPPLFYAFRPE